MWATCYNCNGTGIYIYEKADTFLSEDKHKQVCSICEKYRITLQGFEFYGHIWIDEDYEIVTPPSSPTS